MKGSHFAYKQVMKIRKQAELGIAVTDLMLRSWRE